MIGESPHADHVGTLARSPTRSAQWAIYAVLAGLLAVLVMTGVFFARSIQLEKRDYLIQNDAIARSVAASIEAREAGYLDVLRAYNGRLPLQEAVRRRDRAQALVHLRQLRQVFPELDRTFLADPAGIVWVTEPETPKVYGKSYAFRDWYRGVSRAWRPYMSEIYRTDLGGSLAIAMALPVRDRDDRVIGILASVQRLETLRQWLLPVEVPNGSLFVVDRNGQLLFHRTRTGPDHVADYAATPVVRSLRQGLNGVAEMEDPVERIISLAAYRWLPTLGWGVVVQRAENLALQRTRARIGLSALVALILTGTLAALGAVALRNERRIVAANERLQGEIVERRRAEEATAAANRAKSEFLSRMSHELRTPLNSIIGFTELLLTSTRDTLSDRQRSALERVRESGRHLLELINEVLDLSKIEAGRMDVRAEAFELLPLVLECLGAIEPQAQAKGLTVRPTGLEGAPQIVQDRGKVKQILINLLSNAVKFTEQGGVDLRLERPDAASVSIAVADSGIGISLEDQAVLFQAFQQVGSSKARAQGGTGLGLAISRRLAELIDGTLTVNSQPGRGSIFTLRLPARYRPPTLDDATDQTESRPGTARVLVIDDDRDVPAIIRQAVVDEPLTIEWAASASDGFARIRTRRPAVIVLDVMLQDHDDGWDVLGTLKTDPATRDIPVVVHSVIDNPQRALRLGADELLLKPASPASVRTSLRRVLDASRQAQTRESA